MSPSASLAYSPGNKTPFHSKQLSQSTIEADPADLGGYKISFEAKKKLFDLEKETKLLNKVKSEKIICKSPGNTSKYAKEKGTTKKPLKQG